MRQMMRAEPDLADGAKVLERMFCGFRRASRAEAGRVENQILEAEFPRLTRQAISFGMDLLTKPYDNFEILRIAARIALRIGRRTQDRKFICSELVDECYRAVGVRFVRRDNYISPDDIWRDPGVRMLARVR